MLQREAEKQKNCWGWSPRRAKNAAGAVVFMDDDTRYLREVPTSVRFVDISEYGIDSADALFGFICGMYSQNYDIGAVYIDSFLKIIGKQPAEAEDFFQKFTAFCDKNNIHAVLSVSAEAETAPEFLKAWMI